MLSKNFIQKQPKDTIQERHVSAAEFRGIIVTHMLSPAISSPMLRVLVLFNYTCLLFNHIFLHNIHGRPIYASLRDAVRDLASVKAHANNSICSQLLAFRAQAGDGIVASSVHLD